MEKLKFRVPPSAVESEGHRHRFKERRFAGAVLAHEESHIRFELEEIKVANRWDRERVFCSICDFVALQRNLPQIEHGLHFNLTSNERSRLWPKHRKRHFTFLCRLAGI